MAPLRTGALPLHPSSVLRALRRSAAPAAGASLFHAAGARRGMGGTIVTPPPLAAATLESLEFDNVAVRTLPIDPVEENYVRRVPNACFSKVKPSPVASPRIVSFSESCLDLLGVSAEEMIRPDAAEYMSGNILLPGASPHAHCYCGFQFGAFSGQLGDGAAIYLGEVLNKEDGLRWEIQLKGAGKTPYSRSADGRKVLRSSIREYLCSEAMAGLGIPTTRAAALVTSDTMIQRDPLYNGNVINERASIVMRVAPTFIRFGSFEIFKGQDPTTGRSGPSTGNLELQKQLLNYVVESFFPEAAIQPEGSAERALSMLEEVARSTAELVAMWQCSGFTHGVLNTDNMSIMGLTIDYGPFGFMESYDPSFVPNGSDGTGRYRYADQPEICRWNVMKLGEALAPILPREKWSHVLQDVYDATFEAAQASRMSAKLGLETEQEGDRALFDSLFSTMQDTAVDFTGLFRVLAGFDSSKPKAAAADLGTKIASICGSPESLAASMRRAATISSPRIPESQLQMLYTMAREQPDQIALRFGAPPEAILEELEGEMRKLEILKRLNARVSQLDGMTPQDKSSRDAALWEEWLCKYAQRLALEPERSLQQREEAMNSVNPAYILRNWIAQAAIEKAEKGDYSEVNSVLDKLRDPFKLHETKDDLSPFRQPGWAAGLICTCSS